MLNPRRRSRVRTALLAEAESFLRPLKSAAPPPDDALVFGVGGQPFHAASLCRRADAAWMAARLPDRLRLHQARHTYASFMIAAGVNAKALSAFMGHSSIKVTFDLYGHLMPGTAQEVAALLDTFLATELQAEAAEARCGVGIGRV
jgi:integrase